jgi:hypothetical protein
MDTFQSGNLSAPDETMTFDRGQVLMVKLDGFNFGRGTFDPGWRWSNDVKPLAGTESCETPHNGFCESGSMTVRMDDGSEHVIRPGDVFVIPPGHDAWVNPEDQEPCVLYDAGVGYEGYTGEGDETPDETPDA